MIPLILKLLWKGLLFLIGSIGLYLLAAFTLPYITVNNSFRNSKGGIRMFILSNGVHTDLVVPANTVYKNWQNDFPPALFNATDPAYSYISFGWGDKGFYLETPTWADLKFSTAFKATFALSETAMHVAYSKPLNGKSRRCTELYIDEATYKKLINYIESSFEKNEQGIIKIDAPGYGGHDLFYEALGTYSLFKTCNTWTNRGLKEAGIKTALWSPFAKGLIHASKE